MRIAAPLIYSGEAGRYEYFETISDAAGTCDARWIDRRSETKTVNF